MSRSFRIGGDSSTRRRITILTSVVALTATLIPSAATFAGFAPVNDSFLDPAIAASLPYSATQSTVGSTGEPGEPTPSCSAAADTTVWFRYRSRVAMILTADTFGSDFDTILAAYQATSGGFVEARCNDDFSGVQSRIKFTAQAGTTYYFQVDGFGADTGSLQFNLDGVPVSNKFAKATVISTLPFTAAIQTHNATLQLGEPQNCGLSGYSVWHRYTPSTGRTLSADTYGSAYDTVLAVYRGATLSGLTLIGCNDDSGGTFQSRVSWFAQGGRTYYIQVGAFASNSGGDLSFNLTRVP